MEKEKQTKTANSFFESHGIKVITINPYNSNRKRVEEFFEGITAFTQDKVKEGKYKVTIRRGKIYFQGQQYYDDILPINDKKMVLVKPHTYSEGGSRIETLKVYDLKNRELCIATRMVFVTVGEPLKKKKAHSFEITKEAFERYFVIDVTGSGQEIAEELEREGFNLGKIRPSSKPFYVKAE